MLGNLSKRSKKTAPIKNKCYLINGKTPADFKEIKSGWFLHYSPAQQPPLHTLVFLISSLSRIQAAARTIWAGHPVPLHTTKLLNETLYGSSLPACHTAPITATTGGCHYKLSSSLCSWLRGPLPLPLAWQRAAFLLLPDGGRLWGGQRPGQKWFLSHCLNKVAAGRLFLALKAAMACEQLAAHVYSHEGSKRGFLAC